MSSPTRPQSYLLTDLTGGAVLTDGRPPADLQVALHAIADRLRCLSPSHRDPHRFHEDKAELVDELRRLARRRVAA